MREILFRGKRADNNAWIYGSLTQFYSDGIAYICGQRDEVDPVTLGVIPSQDYELEVYFKTVGQMTGIEDKNGNMIFEGDIVRWKVGSIKCVGQVVYGTGEWLKGWPEHNMQSLRTYMASTEVIGNVHDNPELMPAER